MELFEYIKSQLPHLPNPAIMKNMGASDELIDYVRETVWNTNLNILNSINSGGGGDTVTVKFGFFDVTTEKAVLFDAIGKAVEGGSCTEPIDNPLVVAKGTEITFPMCISVGGESGSPTEWIVCKVDANGQPILDETVVTVTDPTIVVNEDYWMLVRQE